MAIARDREGTGANSLLWQTPATTSAPLLALLTDVNGKLLESVAGAQKDWADFVHRRIKEDIALSQQLMSCRSLADAQEIWAQYVRTALDQYGEQSEKAVKRGKVTTESLAQTVERGATATSQEVRH
jgi:hypothetical protein